MLTYNFSPWYYGFKRPKFGPMQSEGRLFIPVHFLKLTLMRLLIYISVISMMISCSPRKEHGEPINILFIMTDQHRGDCIGSAGAHWLATPNLDALASEGVLFSNAYVSVPSCLPARASILTGKSPWGHGMLGYYPIPESHQYELPQMFTDASYGLKRSHRGRI